MLGIVLGITLVSPQLMSASDYVAALEAGDPVKYWDFGSFHINMAGYLGVTEPAMFGVNLKYLYPFVGAMLTSGVMGIVSRLFGVIANSVGVGGLPAFLSMRGDKILVYILCIVIDIALAFLITVVLSKTKLKDMGVHYESGK